MRFCLSDKEPSFVYCLLWLWCQRLIFPLVLAFVSLLLWGWCLRHAAPSGVTPWPSRCQELWGCSAPWSCNQPQSCSQTLSWLLVLLLPPHKGTWDVQNPLELGIFLSLGWQALIKPNWSGSGEAVSLEGQPCKKDRVLWAYVRMAPFALPLPQAGGKVCLIFALRT